LPQFAPNNRFFLFPDRWTIHNLISGEQHASTQGIFTPDSKRIVRVVDPDGNLAFVSAESNTIEVILTGLGFTNFPPDIKISPRGDIIAYAKRDPDGTIGALINPLGNVTLVATPGTTGIQLKWAGGSGKYRLESTTELSPASWQALSNETSETTYTTPNSKSITFFRVISLNP
jgi:hypothetical protein